MQITPPFCPALTLYIEMGREKMTKMEKTRTNIITNARCLHTQTTRYGQTPPLKNFTQVQYLTVPLLELLESNKHSVLKIYCCNCIQQSNG